MIQGGTETIVRLEVVKREEITKFKKNLQEAFAVAVVETFGSELGQAIPSDQDIEKSCGADGAVVYHILLNDKQIGGVVLTINEVTQHNVVDFFFILVSEHNRGIGLKAWNAIEEKYSETKCWETYTPYFEKRNINFYINKCGFQIVEYFNKHHFDSNTPSKDDILENEDFFRFEKVMKR